MGSGSTEIWYRGEGVGVPPAKPGGFLHDFGDGLYLTDSESVAKIYASRRAATPADQRVSMIQLERVSLGQVLDLTTDARWSEFMNRPIAKGLQGRLFYLNIKHELYDQFFREFLAQHKIDIRKFDAVVGPEYNLGGKQLCILHKQSLPTKLQRRIRALFRPASAAATIQVEGARVRLTLPTTARPRIAFLKSAGTFVVTSAAMILISYFVNKQIQKMYGKIAENQLKALEPEIDKTLNTQRRRTFDILAGGHKAYGIISFEISHYMTLDNDPVGGGWDQSAPGVKLIWVDVRDYKVERVGKEQVTASFGQRHHTTRHTTSSELTLPGADVTGYRSAIEALEWYDQALRSPHIFEADKTMLSTQKQALLDAIDAFYGKPPSKDEIPFEQLFPEP